MPKDRVQPLKLEDPGSGGVETDGFPTALDPSEDYLDCHGVTIQSETSNDDDVYLGRDTETDDLLFADKVAGGPYTLTELLAASTFDPGILIITTWGGLVYNRDGILVVKRNP